MYSFPIWSHLASKTLDDAKYVDEKNLEGYTFPGYIAKEKYPFIPLSVMTHRNEDEINTNWCRGDDPALFQKNLSQLGNTWHYANKQVTYNVNSNGYRAAEWDDIDWENAIVLAGCSMTFGVGVNEDETIGYFLEKITKRPVVNLGYPAGSNELIFNNVVSIFEHFANPYAVVANWSTTDRFLFYSMDVVDVGLWTDQTVTVDGVKLEKLFKGLNYNITNMAMKSYFIEKATRQLCKDKSKYYSMSCFPSSSHYMRTDWHFLPDKNARDLIHPGPQSNRLMAEHLSTVLS